MPFVETATHRPLEATLPSWGVSVLESHHARDFRMEASSHEFWQLLYVLRGQGTLHCPAFRAFSLRSGDVALLPVRVAHGLEDEPGNPLSIYAVNLAPHFLTSLVAFHEQPLRLRRESLKSAMPDVLRRLLLEQTLRKPGFEAMMSGLAFQLLAMLVRVRETPGEIPPDKSLASHVRVEAYRHELERTFYRCESVDQVAARLGLSRRRFTELFRSRTGDSWLATVRKLRVAYAQRLLKESNRTVLAIAFECGFEDVSSFYRAFKSVAGCSPDVWRKTDTQ